MCLSEPLIGINNTSDFTKVEMVKKQVTKKKDGER